MEQLKLVLVGYVLELGYNKVGVPATATAFNYSCRHKVHVSTHGIF